MARADGHLRDPGFWGRITRPWDLRHQGYGAPPVEPARRCDEVRRAS